MAAKAVPKEKFCSFPNCTGGSCHFCSAVHDQRAVAPLYAAATRVLEGKGSKGDVEILAKYVKANTAPNVDEKTSQDLHTQAEQIRQILDEKGSA